MAASFLSNPTTFLQSSSSSSLTSQKQHTVKGTSVCKPVCRLPNYPPHISKRSLSINLTSLFLLSFTGNANAAILEADDDLELLEKVKQDRKKRIEKQTVLNSANKDKEYLQDVIYKLSKVGQAIENNDLPSAGSILGQTDADWLKKANAALSQLSSSPEEKAEVDTFNSSLTSLYSSVTKNDIEGSKTAFVDSASAFEKWTTLTGLTGQLKGL
ncbi:putative chloroplast thylakoid lumenal protein MPH2 [Helianthus annuus]|nr:putative chloroplast thylakoid lumenal protein MPH2 [Helianthus annuus]KAJ0531558.1 putative chloroplast thylakoid lumenal protein MPH2 [Helianthus annuus]